MCCRSQAAFGRKNWVVSPTNGADAPIVRVPSSFRCEAYSLPAGDHKHSVLRSLLNRQHGGLRHHAILRDHQRLDAGADVGWHLYVHLVETDVGWDESAEI